MKEILSQLSAYFISPNAPATSPLVIAGLVVSGLMLALGIVAPLLKKKAQADWFTYVAAEAGMLRIAGLVWLLLFFLRFEGIRPFNYRAWAYVFVLPFAIWAWLIYKNEKKKEPAKAEAKVRYDHYDKYLPAAKSRR